MNKKPSFKISYESGTSFFIIVFFVCMITSPRAFSQEKSIEKWGNNFVEFSFNTKEGNFSIRDKRDSKVIVEDAAFQINTYLSTEGYSFKSSAQNISDELGKGKKISIEGTKQNLPSLILEVFIYDKLGCLALNVGIRNTSNNELRVTQFIPLKATAFNGFSFGDYKTLDGEDGVAFTKVSSVDTLNCFNNLLATFGKMGEKKHSLVIGGLTYNEFQKRAMVIKQKDHLSIQLTAIDPVGKLVDAHSKYIFKDKFYIDFTTDNRFEALEKYADALRLATHADIKGVTIPILNFWYAFIPKYGGDGFADNSTGTVDKMNEIVKTGFLKYSPIGLRLEPDDYALPNNQQGWWDDKHWQMYKGGQLLQPYETIVKWGTKIRAMGGVPFIYCQTAKRSEDYCLQHPDQMLFNDPYKPRSKGRVGWWGRNGDSTAAYWTYDFTDTGFIHHMKNVYQNLKNGGVQGIKFDYPETGWSYDGGFEDKYATTTSAYRNIFKLAYDGLGKNRDVQERIPPYGDVALGVITTQRTEGDNDRAYPGRLAKTGLRWYKNRMVTNYDCDPINPDHVYPDKTRDGWRAALTMTYTTSGRLEIGKYFEKMSSDQLYDLSRVVPLLSAPTKSARPADAFSGKTYPEVYDFTIKPDWHIVTFYNSKIDGEEWPKDVGPYGSSDSQFIPKKMLPSVINISLGNKTDDGGLGFNAAKKYYVFDFWNWNFIGKIAGNAKLEQPLRAGEARIMSVHEAKKFPQFISTNRHILQGYLDMTKYPEWHPQQKELTGTSKLIGDEVYKVVIAANGYKIKQCSASNAKCEIAVLDKVNSIYELKITGKKLQTQNGR